MKRMFHRTSVSTAGYTLGEALVVIAIVGILAAIALPSIDVARFQIESGLRSVASTLQTAQRESVARQHDVVVMIDTIASRIVVHFDADNSGTVNGTERVRAWPIAEQLVFDRGPASGRAFGAAATSFPAGAGGLPMLTFRRNGSASVAGGIYLTSRQAAAGVPKRQNDTRAIEVVRATGRIDWFRYVNGQWRMGF